MVFGMILIEDNPLLKDLTLEEYVHLSVENLENVSKVQTDSAFVEIKSEPSKFFDFDSLCLIGKNFF